MPDFMNPAAVIFEIEERSANPNRVAGSQIPAFFRGRPRGFWTALH